MMSMVVSVSLVVRDMSVMMSVIGVRVRRVAMVSLIRALAMVSVTSLFGLPVVNDVSGDVAPFGLDLGHSHGISLGLSLDVDSVGAHSDASGKRSVLEHFDRSKIFNNLSCKPLLKALINGKPLSLCFINKI